MAEERLMSPATGKGQPSFHTFNTQFCPNTTPKSGNHLECRVCEEGFSVSGDKVPRLLYCGHTLCHACLLRLPVNDGQSDQSAAMISCPFDRQTTPVGTNGVWGLKKNFALLEVLERGNAANSFCDKRGARPLLSPDLLTRNYPVSSSCGSAAVACDEDESHVAVLYCTVCASHLCHACSERSHATRTLHTHRRIPIADKPREKPRCPAHPSHTVEFVCLEADCASGCPLMCFICKDYKHTKHKHALLESEAEAVRSDLSAASLSIKRNVLQLAHLLRKLDLTARQLEDQPSDAVDAEPPLEPTALSAILHPIAELSGGPSDSSSPSSSAGPSSLSPPSQLAVARDVVRSHFCALRQQLQQQETVAMGALEAHVRERLCSLRQQQEDLSSLISQMVGLVLESERCLQQDDGRVLVGGRSLTARLQLLQTPQLEAIEQGLQAMGDNIPITFTKDNRIHIGAVLEMRVVTLGLDGAGKTSILFQLQQNACPNTIPTIGFNVETLHYKNFKFTIWDVGGGPKLRPLWRHYYYNTQAIIFVVDCSDGDRVEEASGELTKLMMERELRDAPLLIYANKQDMPGCLSPPDLSLALGAGKLCSGRAWHVVGCDARTGEGLTDGLDWLTRQLGPLNG